MILTSSMKAAHLRLLQSQRVHTHAAISLTERERRHGPIPRSNAAISTSQSGLPKRVEINGRVYATHTEAARKLGHSIMTITRMVREGRARLL